ncbi:MAG: rRNA maturation RNase YbeY [Hyphomicrobiales bacterium]
MAVVIDVDNDAWRGLSDLEGLAERAIEAALRHEGESAAQTEVSLLFTGDAEAARLNERWRNRTYAPNVLSFPAHKARGIAPGAPVPLGDIVLAAGVVEREAREQEKTMEAHTVHLIVHGLLHLLGRDHEDAAQASEMEAAETAILADLGYAAPYER